MQERLPTLPKKPVSANQQHSNHDGGQTVDLVMKVWLHSV